MGQFDLFGARRTAPGPSRSTPCSDIDAHRGVGPSHRLAFEREMLGLYVSDHPLDGIEQALAAKADTPIAGDPRGRRRGRRRSPSAGILAGVNRRVNKNGEPWASADRGPRRSASRCCSSPDCYRWSEYDRRGRDRAGQGPGEPARRPPVADRERPRRPRAGRAGEAGASLSACRRPVHAGAWSSAQGGADAPPGHVRGAPAPGQRQPHHPAAPGRRAAGHAQLRADGRPQGAARAGRASGEPGLRTRGEHLGRAGRRTASCPPPSRSRPAASSARDRRAGTGHHRRDAVLLGEHIDRLRISCRAARPSTAARTNRSPSGPVESRYRPTGRQRRSAGIRSAHARSPTRPRRASQLVGPVTCVPTAPMRTRRARVCTPGGRRGPRGRGATWATRPSAPARPRAGVPAPHGRARARQSRPSGDAEWRDALVIVERGRRRLECAAGGRRRSPAARSLWLDGDRPAVLHNVGDEPVVLLAVSRPPDEEPHGPPLDLRSRVRASTTCWPPTARTSGTRTRRCRRPRRRCVVESAPGVRLRLADGRELVDGMSSWWAAIHGYRHPVLDAAVARPARRG